MGSGFSFWHKSPSGIFSVSAQYKSMHKIGHWTKPEHMVSEEICVTSIQCIKLSDHKNEFWHLFKCSQNIAKVLMMLTVPMTVSHLCQNLEIVKGVRSLKIGF